MELYAIHIICSIREDKPYILTDKEREEALLAFAECADSNVSFEQEFPFHLQGRVFLSSAKECDRTGLPLSKLKKVNKVTNTSIIIHEESYVDSQNASTYLDIGEKSSYYQTLRNLKTEASTDVSELEGVKYQSFSERKKYSAELERTLNFSELSLSESLQRCEIDLNSETEAGEIQIQNQHTFSDKEKTSCVKEEEYMKNSPQKRKAKSKSIFHHFFAFDDTFQPFSFVFGDSSNCEIISSQSSQKSGVEAKRAMVQHQSYFSLSACPEPYVKTITNFCSSAVFSEGNEVVNRALNQKIDKCQTSCFTPEESEVNLSDCSDYFKSEFFAASPHIRRHSVDTGQLSSGLNKQSLTQGSPYLLEYRKKDKSTCSCCMDDDLWQGNVENGSDPSQQFKERRASADSGSSMKQCSSACLSKNCPWNGLNDKIQRNNKESRLSQLRSRLVRAMGLKKETAEESGKVSYKIRPKKSKSSDLILKDCPECKNRKLWSDISNNESVSALSCKDTLPRNDAKNYLLCSNRKEVWRCMGGKDVLSNTYEDCDKMVCLDLPLTNFGFYSGEMMILM